MHARTHAPLSLPPAGGARPCAPCLLTGTARGPAPRRHPMPAACRPGPLEGGPPPSTLSAQAECFRGSNSGPAPLARRQGRAKGAGRLWAAVGTARARRVHLRPPVLPSASCFEHIAQAHLSPLQARQPAAAPAVKPCPSGCRPLSPSALTSRRRGGRSAGAASWGSHSALVLFAAPRPPINLMVSPADPRTQCMPLLRIIPCFQFTPHRCGAGCGGRRKAPGHGCALHVALAARLVSTAVRMR